MAETAEQKSWREITAELDTDEKALRGLINRNDEIDEPLSGFHRVWYDRTPSRAPGWAKHNWWAAETALKRAGAKDAVIRLVAHTKVSDLMSLMECLRLIPSARAEWERWHPEWVAAEVARIEAEHTCKSKRDPSSERSILASLTDQQRRTWQSYKKLSTRRSRGTGQRQRSPSKALMAIRHWEAAHRRDAKIIRGLIIEKQGIAFLAREVGLTNGGLLERLRLVLDRLQHAIERAKSLKGPQKVPQEIRERRAKRLAISPIQ